MAGQLDQCTAGAAAVRTACDHTTCDTAAVCRGPALTSCNQQAPDPAGRQAGAPSQRAASTARWHIKDPVHRPFLLSSSLSSELHHATDEMPSSAPPWYIREFTGRRLVWNLFFYGSHAGLFCFGWWKQASDPKLAGLNTLRFSVWLSRGECCPA